MRLVCLVVCVAAACDSSSTSTLKIEAAEPDFGRLSGGTRITLRGEGFLSDGAAPNRVVIAGREAPLAGAIDDSTLEVVVPPGEAPGPADIIVINRNGLTTASGIFHYSEAPAITGVTPEDVQYDSTTTVVTVTGSGFTDEAAGPARVLVNGEPAVDVDVRSDTELVFTALPGTVLTRASIEIHNERGMATREDAFRYAPGPRGGLLLFSEGGVFFTFFDPVDNRKIVVTRKTTNNINKIRAVVADENGDYWALSGNTFGRIDLQKQEFVDPVTNATHMSAIARNGSTYYAISRIGRFGTVNLATGGLTPVGTGTFSCCNGNAGIAIDSAGQAVMTAANAIRSVNLETGELGSAVALTSPTHIVDQRFFDGVLYAASRDGSLVTLNPATGNATPVAQLGLPVTAMEVVP